MSQDREVSYAVGVQAAEATGTTEPVHEADHQRRIKRGHLRIAALATGAVVLVAIAIALIVVYGNRNLWCYRGCGWSSSSIQAQLDVALFLSGGSASQVDPDVVCDVESAVMQAALIGVEQMQLESTMSIYPSWVAVADASAAVALNTTRFYYAYEVPTSCHSGNTSAANTYSRAPNLTAVVAMNVSLSLYIYVGNVSVGAGMAASIARSIADSFSNVTNLARNAKLISDWSSATNSSIDNTTLSLASFPVVSNLYQSIAMT